MKSYYINVCGGLGYNISLARVISYYGDKYNFYVKTPYLDIFQSCPKVKHVYKENEGRDFLFEAQKENAEIIQHRLYDMSDFIKKRLNYTQAWIKLLGLEEIDEEIKSSEGTNLKNLHLEPLKYFPALKNNISIIYNELKEKGYNDFILVQFWGGQTPLAQAPDGDWSQIQYSYECEPLKRAYPIEKAQEFVTLYKSQNPKTAIIQYSLPNEPLLEGCERYISPYTTYYELSKSPQCKGAVTIDSSLAHLISGNCKVITLWGHSLPQNFGYAFNKNIIQNCDRSEILYFTELGSSGAKIEYIEPKKLLEEVNDYLK